MEDKKVKAGSVAVGICLFIIAILLVVIVYVFYNSTTAKNNLQSEVDELKTSLEEKDKKVEELEDNMNKTSDETEINASNKNEENTREYFIEGYIFSNNNTKSYDFDTKKWLQNNGAVYYIATDSDNYLCIINAKRELVHKTDIVINQMIVGAQLIDWNETLMVMLEDATTYDINIKTFEYTKYIYASGE